MINNITEINLNIDIFIKEVDDISTTFNKYTINSNFTNIKNNINKFKYDDASINIKAILTNFQLFYLDLYNSNKINEYKILLDIDSDLIEAKYLLDSYFPEDNSTYTSPDIERQKKLNELIEKYKSKLESLGGYSIIEYINNITMTDYYNNKVNLINNKIRIETDSNKLVELNLEKTNNINLIPSPLKITKKITTLNNYNYNILDKYKKVNSINKTVKASSINNKSKTSDSLKEFTDNVKKATNGINNLSNLVTGTKDTICAGANLLDAIQGGNINEILGSTGYMLDTASKLIGNATSFFDNPFGSLKNSRKFSKNTSFNSLVNPANAINNMLGGFKNFMGAVQNSLVSCDLRKINCGHNKMGKGLTKLGNLTFGGVGPCGVTFNKGLQSLIGVVGNNNAVLNTLEMATNRSTLNVLDNTIKTFGPENSSLKDLIPIVQEDRRNTNISRFNSNGISNGGNLYDKISSSNNYKSSQNYKPWVNPNKGESVYGNPDTFFDDWKIDKKQALADDLETDFY
jgi:hypothetical protein